MIETMSPRGRVEALIKEREELGRPLVFVATGPAGRVHVVGPDEDQPGHADVVSWLLSNRFRAVCGRVIVKTATEGLTGAFKDSRLCPGCGRAFNEISFDAGALIFEDNDEDIQNWAPGTVARIQREKRSEKAERVTGSSATGGTAPYASGGEA